MLLIRISTRRHPEAARLRDARDGKDPSALFVEGARLADELLKSSGVPRSFYATRPILEGRSSVINDLMSKKIPAYELTEDVMRFVSDVKTPPGLIVLAGRPPISRENLLKKSARPLFVILAGLQAPNNLGAVARTAEAAGVDGVFQCGGADPYGPKALRASAGALFRLPVLHDKPLEAVLDEMSRAKVDCVAADPLGDTPFTAWDWSLPTALVLGEEAAGLRALPADIPRLRIPMRKPVESLNVAVAAGLFLYEAVRQRNEKAHD